MATKQDVHNALKEVSTMANSPVTPENIGQIVDAYFSDLQDLDPDLLTAAVQGYRASGNPFFPSSGAIRDKATELQLLAMGIPTAAEAWAQVKKAYQYQAPVFCGEGSRLREECETHSENYWDAIAEYKNHVSECEECVIGGYSEQYNHPAVARVVELLGGRDALMTDNEVSDRAKFFESYNAIIKRETLRASLPVVAREFVETKQLEAMQSTKLLAKGMTK